MSVLKRIKRTVAAAKKSEEREREKERAKKRQKLVGLAASRVRR